MILIVITLHNIIVPENELMRIIVMFYTRKLSRKLRGVEYKTNPCSEKMENLFV